MMNNKYHDRWKVKNCLDNVLQDTIILSKFVHENIPQEALLVAQNNVTTQW